MNNQSRLATISCISNTSKAILKAGLIILPDALFIFTIRTTSFEPPYLSKILPIGQCDRGISFIITITKSAACMISSSIFVRLLKWVNTHFSRTLPLQPELISTFFLSLLGLWFGYASPMSKSFGANGSKSDISSLIEVKMKMNNGNILKVWSFVLYKGNQVKKFCTYLSSP